MLGGTSIVISGWSEVKAAPTAFRISVPSPVPTTASFSAAEQGTAASAEDSARENRVCFIVNPMHCARRHLRRRGYGLSSDDIHNLRQILLFPPGRSEGDNRVA